MSEANYAIIRVTEGGQAEVVHTTEKLKDARYWLTYIALPGDAMFKTTNHPKYAGKDGQPEYFAHLIKRGQVAHNERQWLESLGTAERSSIAWPEIQPSA